MRFILFIIVVIVSFQLLLGCIWNKYLSIYISIYLSKQKAASSGRHAIPLTHTVGLHQEALVTEP